MTTTRAAWRRALLGLGAFAVAYSGRAAAQTVGKELSLSTAISIARAANPGLQADANDGVVAAAQLRAAQRDLFAPTVNTSSTATYSAPGQRRAGSVVLTEQPSIYSSSYNLSLGYTLSGSRIAQPAVSRADLNATLSRLASSKAQLQHDVADHYLRVQEAEQAVVQAELELSRSNDFLKLTRVREALGAASPLDLKRAEVQVAQGEVKLAHATSDVRTERTSLSRILGVVIPSDARLTTSFELSEPTWNADTLIAIALRSSVALEAKRSARDAATARVRIARMAYAPTVSASVSLTGWTQRAGSEEAAVAQQLGGSTDPVLAAKIRARVADDFRGFPFNFARQPITASVTVSYPLLPGWTRESQMAQSRAAREDADYGIKTEEWRIRTEVENNVRVIESAYREARLQNTVKQKAGEELRLVLDRARMGAVAGLAIADAQSQLGEAELAESKAIFAYHRALLDLELSVGFPLITPRGQ